MREKYESLALGDLKEIAKARGMKGISAMKKAELIDVMIQVDEKENKPQVLVEPFKELKVETQPVPEIQIKPEIQTKPEITGDRPIKKNIIMSTGNSGRPSFSNQSTNHSVNEKNNPRSNQGVIPSNQETVVHQNFATNQNPVSNQNSVPNQSFVQNQSSSPSGNPYYTPNINQNMPQNAGPGNAKYPSSQNAVIREDDRAESEIRESESKNDKQEEEKFSSELDSGVSANGILEVMPDGYGFIRCANYLPGENDVYVAPSQIRRFGLKTGDIVEGNTRIKSQNEKFSALLFVKKINGYKPEIAVKRGNFEDMIPIFPNERLKLEIPGAPIAMRIMDLISPVGKGQRGMIVSPPKAGKTTLLKEVAKSIKMNSPGIHLIILLIDERPEEVTDIKEAIEGPNVEVIYSTFDELPDHHKRVSEMVIERAKRLVEHKRDVCILLDSITRLTRAYNLTVPPSGRTLSGGLDPAALYMPKRFFGAARNMRGGGSLTILATALVDTGSKMDDVVYEEFKGTGNMEMVLDRKLSERRVFPAIDIPKSGTRREDLLLTPEELEAINIIRKALTGLKSDDAVDKIIDMFSKTKNNAEFVSMVKKINFF